MGSNYTPYDNLGEVSATNTLVAKKVPNANHGYKYAGRGTRPPKYLKKIN